MQPIRRLNNQPVVTYALLAVTVLVFAFETISGGSTNSYVLLRYGARYNPLILMGQWWRLITPMFVHIGVTHIVVNAVSLYYLGSLTERLVGHWRFLLIYLVSGIAGNVASFVFNADALAAGASTAIFGLMGAFLMLGDAYRDNLVVRQLARQFTTLALVNLAFNLFSSGVDIYGHIGGLLGGFLITGSLGAPALGQMNGWRRAISAIGLVFAMVALLKIGYGRVG